jgi:hypothetical protein
MSILIKKIYILALFFGLFLIHPVSAGDWNGQNYLINGVYYLVSQGDLNMAEEQFREVIFSSPFDALSEKTGNSSSDRKIVAEAFYFLGKICYERAISKENVSQNISQAKSYLMKAEEYGIVYDKLHPSLLDEINRDYPEIKALIPQLNAGKANVTIEIGDSLYQIRSVKIDQNANVTENRFLTKTESELECDARYKMKPDVQGSAKSVYKALITLGIGLAFWLVRG